MAEGMRMVDPGGNSIAYFKSQRTRWPPEVGSKDPKAVMAHHPQVKFAWSLWGNETVCGPKLMVAEAKTDFSWVGVKEPGDRRFRSLRVLW